MKTRTGELVLASAVSVAAVAQMMSLFLPPVYEVRSGSHSVDPKALRSVQVMGSILALSVGFAASVVAHHPFPMLSSAIGVAVIFAIYDWSIQHPFEGS